MDSGFRQQQYQHHFQDEQRHLHQQKQQMNSGLTRFRSAPSSYFASFLDAAADTLNTKTSTPPGGGGGGGGEREDFSNARPLSPETENIFARFMSSMCDENNSSSSQKLCDIPENSAVQQEFLVQVKQERETQQQQQQQHYQQQHQQQGNCNTSSQQMIYQSQSKPPLANHKSSAMENSFRSTAQSSMGMHSLSQMNNNNNNSSGLTRHSSSPAGFFNSILLDIDNGYGVMKGMGNYGASNGQTNFSQGQPSSTSGLMTQSSDFDGKRFSNSANNNNNNNNNSINNDSNYISGYPMNSWDDSVLSESFSGFDRGGGDEDTQTFSEVNGSENQSEGRNRPQLLAHHLSLPSSSAMEKMLQFQDTVPCRIRAKRGCATHPRSIAERVRRTRISERMRKLQDLVPSMDKQTNTADMLDLAVEYIKDLQNQVKNLNDNRAKCTCSR